MKNILLGLLFALIILSVLSGIGWSVATKFGKETGIYIKQKVTTHSVIKDSYEVATYIWLTNWLGGNGTIEYSKWDNVGRCQVDSTKKAQRKIADSVYIQIKEAYKNRKKQPCQ